MSPFRNNKGSPVIEVEHLSKRYYINHQKAELTFAETLSKQAKKLWQCLKGKRSSSYEEFWALDDLSFTVNSGDRLGIIGRNGAGKSTLLKILSLVTSPTKGRIKIRGRVASLLEVGTGFHPDLTGRENIFLNGAILGMSAREIRKNFDHIVAFAEVEKFLDIPIKRYSTGMQTRLGFAIAAHLDPDILITDEVLAVGDAQFQEKCLQKLNDLSQQGKTIIFVSHDYGSVLSLCNKTLYLKQGKIVLEGSAEHCVSAYLSTIHKHENYWEGDCGDEHVQFSRLAINKVDSGREFIYQGQKVNVEIDFTIKQQTPDLVLSLGVWNQRNQLLAQSHTWDNDSMQEMLSTVGSRKASFVLDTSLLNAGEYILRLDCCIYNVKKVLQEEVGLKFAVCSQNKLMTPHINSTSMTLGQQWKIDRT